MLIHANSQWSDTVTANLWPYAIRMANEAVKHTPSFQDNKRRTPIELFTGSKASSNLKHWKPFAGDAKSGDIKKYKARLNIDGSRMRKGEHYNMTYSPVASWNFKRMLLTLTACLARMENKAHQLHPSIHPSPDRIDSLYADAGGRRIGG